MDATTTATSTGPFPRIGTTDPPEPFHSAPRHHWHQLAPLALCEACRYRKARRARGLPVTRTAPARCCEAGYLDWRWWNYRLLVEATKPLAADGYAVKAGVLQIRDPRGVRMVERVRTEFREAIMRGLRSAKMRGYVLGVGEVGTVKRNLHDHVILVTEAPLDRDILTGAYEAAADVETLAQCHFRSRDLIDSLAYAFKVEQFERPVLLHATAKEMGLRRALPIPWGASARLFRLDGAGGKKRLGRAIEKARKGAAWVER